MIFFVLQGMR